jgi:hypothetical protein
MSASTAPLTVGSGFKKFLFEVGELGMLHVEVHADSIQAACRYISSGELIDEFPPELRNEIYGEEFRLLKEL